MKIKIYDKDFNPLTTLINGSTASDFNSLSYHAQVNGIGDASFVVRINNSKINQTTINHYNKIEIADDDGTIRWVGLIVEKTITLDLVTVKCYGLAHVLDKRLTGDAEVHNGQANTEVASILTAVNAVEDTGISAGTMDVTATVNATFNRGKVWTSIKSIADAVGAQYIIRQDRKLYLQTLAGQDLTSSVIFRYEKNSPENANVLQFQTDDDGKAIISETHSKSSTLSSLAEDTAIKTKYGLLEEFKSFTEASDQNTLDQLTANNNQDSGLSPNVALSPTIGDNFEAGDTVRIILNNGFIDIDTEYQILDKTVRIVNGQKLITVKLNLETKTFVKEFKAIKESVESLSRTPITAPGGSGDMTKATYDPTNKNADAFSMGNMVETTTKKILTNLERAWLALQSGVTSGNNTGDQDLSGLAPKDNPTFTTKITTPVIKVTTGAGAGKVLTSDVNGLASWATPAGGGDIIQIQVFS